MFERRNPAANNSSEYNPLIHGTNSLIFTGLRKTEFQLISTQHMLEQYGLAPLGGEVDMNVWGGGTDTLYTGPYIAFGQLRLKALNEYGLQRILDSYTRFHVYPAEKYSATTQRYANDGAKHGFENINNLLINFSRAKQLGGNPLPEERYQKLLKDFNGVIQLYYFFMLLGKHIHPNMDAYKRVQQELASKITDSEEIRKDYDEYVAYMKSYNEIHKANRPIGSYEDHLSGSIDDAKRKVKEAFYQYFSFEKFLEKITISGVDFKEIYNNPTKDNLQQALALLEIPAEAGFSATQFFTSEITELQSQVEPVDMRSFTDYLNEIPINEKASAYKIGTLLNQMFFNKNLTEVFEKLEKTLRHRIKTLNARLKTLQDMIARPFEEVQLNSEELVFMQEPFPVIFIMSPPENKECFVDITTKEHRFYEPLKFGEDIKMIATDTTEHQLWIIKYLRNNHIKNVEVILIDQLKTSLENNQAPPSNPYTNASGNLTLPFFAAMAAARHGINTDDPLTKDAEKYLEIKSTFK